MKKLPKHSKRRKVPKDKKTGVPKKYLSGLKKEEERKRRARLIKELVHYIEVVEEYLQVCLDQGLEHNGK